MNHKRVERIWRREGLKVPQKQPKRGRLWLNDGSCIRLRPEYPGHVHVSPLMFARLPILAGAESPHDPRIATANGLLTQFGAGGALIGPPLGGLIVDGWGWTALGAAIAGLALLMLAGVALSEWIAARSSPIGT